MAHTILLQRVMVADMPFRAQPSSGAEKQRGAMVVGCVDITSYANPAGEIFTARELGLSSIYDIVLVQKEGTTPRVAMVEGSVAGILGATATVSVYVESAGALGEVVNATDIGVWSFIATGEVEEHAEHTSGSAPTGISY